MPSIKNILKLSLVSFFLFLGFIDVDAKNITSSYNYADETVLYYANDVYKREEYKYGLLISEYTQITQYNNTTYFYLCLTDEKVDTSDMSKVSSSCEKLYRFNRYNSSYTVEELNDKILSGNDSIYYYFDSKYYINEALLFLIAISVLLLGFYTFIRDFFFR